MAKSYEELLKEVEEIEREYAKPELKLIDITPLFQGAAPKHAESYKSLLMLIEQIEGRKFARVEYTSREKLAMQQVQVSRAPTVQLQVAATKEQAVQAKAEMNELAEKLGAVKPRFEFRIKRINTKELVLPNLSIADQISELERIIEGMREHVFDREHLEIVKLEIEGLEQTVNDAKKEIRKKKTELSSTDLTLWALRDQRISEAMSLLAKK